MHHVCVVYGKQTGSRLEQFGFCYGVPLLYGSEARPHTAFNAASLAQPVIDALPEVNYYSFHILDLPKALYDRV